MVNNGLVFDGVDDYVHHAFESGFLAFGHGGTLFMEVQLDDISSAQVLFNNQVAIENHFIVDVNSGVLRVGQYDGANPWAFKQSWSGLDTSKHTIAVVYNSSQGTGDLYIDGTEKTGTTTPTHVTPSTDLYIGGLPSGSCVDGKIERVRIYNNVLSATEIQNITNGANIRQGLNFDTYYRTSNALDHAHDEDATFPNHGTIEGATFKEGHPIG